MVWDDSKIECLIVTNALKIEKVRQAYCDIEFAVKDQEFYLLQCRPIVYADTRVESYAIFSQDDIETCSKYYLGTCMNLFHRYLGKQNILRKEIVKNGFHVYKQYYFILNRDFSGDGFIKELEKIFYDSKFVIVEFGDRENRILCKREELKSVFKRRISTSADQYIYARIGEIIQADISGYCSLNEEGDVFVEYVPARIQSIQDGEAPATQVVIHEHKIYYLSDPVIPSVHVIDEKTGKKKVVSYGKTSPSLRLSDIEQLVDFTQRMSATFVNARLEWYIYQGKLFGKDISIEGNELSVSYMGKNILSKGYAEGPIYVLDHLSELDEFAEKYDISLYAHSDMQDKMLEDKLICELIKKLNMVGKPIIFAKRPSIGIMAVIEHIAGAVLCREHFYRM